MAIEFGIGSSNDADVVVAGREAAERAVTSLRGERPDITFVFSSIRFADPRLLRAIRAVTGRAPLVGCSDSGEITTAGAHHRSVTVIGLIASSGKFVTALERELSHSPRKTGARLANRLCEAAAHGVPRALVVFPDGLTSNGSDLLTGLECGLKEPLPIVGGSAGDDSFFERSFQYFDDEVVTDSVPGVLFCGDLTVGIGVRHGWHPLGQARRVTRAAGSVIHQLDRKPALSIYEDYLGVQRAELTSESLANLASSYPLGTAVEGQVEYLLRETLRIGGAGSLVCTGAIPEGSWVRLMIGGRESALDAAQQSAHEALRNLSGISLRGAFVFCNAGRQKMLGTDFQGEIDVIRDALGGSGVRLGGFYGYGELAPTESKAGPRNTFHNTSVVVMAVG